MANGERKANILAAKDELFKKWRLESGCIAEFPGEVRFRSRCRGYDMLTTRAAPIR